MIRTPLFGGLPEEQMRQLLGAGRRRSFARGEIVFHEHDPAATLHVITRGRFAVRVSTPYGEVATLVVLSQGETFGEMALFEEGAVRTATVQALEPGETLAIDRRDFHDLRRRFPQVTEMLISILVDKVRRYTEQLMEALYVPAEIRILRRLLELADIYGSASGGIVVPLKQGDLAGLAGTSRATVNRVLREEEEKGTVVLNRSKTTIIDRARLQRRAESAS